MGNNNYFEGGLPRANPAWKTAKSRIGDHLASPPGCLIQTAEENRDRQVPDPDWIGNLDNPSSITGVLP